MNGEMIFSIRETKGWKQLLTTRTHDGIT